LSFTLTTPPGTVPWQYTTPGNTGWSNATAAVLAAANTGFVNYLSGIQYQNIGTTNTVFCILDGANTIYTGFITGNAQSLQGVVLSNPIRGTVNNAMSVVFLSANSTANIFFNAQGFVGGGPNG